MENFRPGRSLPPILTLTRSQGGFVGVVPNFQGAVLRGGRGEGDNFLVMGPKMILVKGAVFSLVELSTDLKTQIFTFKILVKPQDFVVKLYINIT